MSVTRARLMNGVDATVESAGKVEDATDGTPVASCALRPETKSAFQVLKVAIGE